jgi:hypothetical protein
MEVAGDDGLLDSEHRFAKGKHRDEEELTTISSKRLVGAEKVQRRRAVMEARARARRDPVCALMAARARIMELGDKRGSCRVA